MAAAGDGANLDEAATAAHAEPFHGQGGLLSAGRAFADDLCDVPARVLPEPVLQNGLAPRRRALDDRAVDLLDRPLAELLAQPGRGLARAGEEDDARNRPVQPVHDPQEYGPGFSVLLLHVLLRDV